jgi:hypothetical protein
LNNVSISKENREKNLRLALELMLHRLRDRAIDTAFLNPAEAPFADQVLRTTWEELIRNGCTESIHDGQYRLTAKGWLTALQSSDAASSSDFQKRLGRVLAAMKAYVKGRQESAVISLQDLSTQSGEAEGFIFNIVESKASSTGNERTGAKWFQDAKGRLVEIPVDFNLEPVDIASALTVDHLKRIEELEERLHIAEEDRSQYHCEHCDAPLVGVIQRDYEEHHCVVSYESFACGLVTADGFEERPCPYGPNYPSLDEFNIYSKQEGRIWFCYAEPKTKRARRVGFQREGGVTQADAEERLRSMLAPKKK